ncbi:MAG: bifunctional 3,4-dihydroxy-2-butanone-4-phosphate synthase/GTP cyclohydrolase II [Actinomycetota bacterium]
MTAPAVRLDSIERAIAEIAAGRPVVVVDDVERENEGDLVMAADAMTAEWMAFIVRHTSGVVCVPMTGDALDRLRVPLMTPQNEERMRTAYTVTVDARVGVTTGISAADRTRTVRVLADPVSTADDLVRPGHLLPLRARDGGVLVRPGHTEAAVDLARLAGRQPAGVIAELVEDDGSMRRGPGCRAFADEHGLAMVSIEDLVAYRRRHDHLVDRVAATRLPTRHGPFTAIGYSDRLDGSEHMALVAGELTGGTLADGDRVLVRVHSECLTGDVLGSARCDCGPQLEASLAAVAEAGRGVVVYLRGHEGRGIGLLAKLQAYALQDAGLDTVDANLELGLPADAREYAAAAQVLADLGVRSVRLLTNNPTKVGALQRYGVDVVERVPLAVGVGPENVRYLRTKRDRMGHDIPGLEVKGVVRS